MDSLNTVSDSAITLSALDEMILAVLATAGIVLMWWIFWSAVKKSNEKVSDILFNPAFFRTVAVIGVIAIVAVLSLSNRMSGNITGSILSGIVGYVLGQMSHEKGKKDEA